MLTALMMGSLLLSNLMLWHFKNSMSLFWALLGIACAAYAWSRDLSRESAFLGSHTQKTQAALKLGMVLFIFSEVMLFFSFFWTFFHFSLNPAGDIGLVWPPTGIHSLNTFSIPLMNTLILVSSGLTLTISHNWMLLNSNHAEGWLIVTILLGALFTACQAFEYYQAPFTMMSANYGNIFYLGTGFHGGHVLAGTTLLIISWMKLRGRKYNFLHHVSFEASIWYWHFVDAVWLFLFISIYWWAA